MSLIEPDANGGKQGQTDSLEDDATFRIMADFTYDWEYWIAPNGKLIYCSPSCERITGYKPQDFEKNPQLLHKIIHPEDQPLLGEHFQKTYPEDETKYLEFRIVTRNGDVRWISHACRSIFDDENNYYLGCRVSERDVTDQKLAEIALHKSEEKHRTLFETMTQGVVYQNVDGQITSMNPAAEKILGYSHEELLNRNSNDPLWGAMKEDGSDFPGEEHPAMVAMKTGIKVEDVVMGIKSPSKDEYTWLNIDAIPLFKPGEKSPYQVYTIFEDITARKEVEEALIEKERKLKVLYESLPIGVSIVDENRNIIDVNPALEKILKLSKEELISGKHEKRTYINDDGMEMTLNEFPSAMVMQKEGEIKKAEIGVVTETGETIWTRVVARSLPFPDWKALILTSDITPSKKSEKSLKASEKKYRELVDNSLVGIFKSNLQGEILFANKALASIFDFDSTEELKKNNITDFYENPEDRSFLIKNLKEHGNFADYEVEMFTKNGKKINLLISAHLEDGVISGMFMDISRVKLVEKRLRESEERYHSLFNQMTEGFAVHEIVFNPQGEPVDYSFIDINPAFERLTGLKRENVIGKLKSDVVPDDNVDWAKIYGKVALTGEPIHIADYSDTLKRHYDIYCYSPKPNHFATIFNDITERKVAEDNLEVTIKRLEKSNYDLEQFAYVASHDLQEPLRMITSFLQLLKKRYSENLDSDANDFIGFAVDGADRMQKLINGLLTFSSLNTKTIEFREIDAEEVLDQVKFESQIFIENNDAVITHDPLPVIFADYTQMVQLLQNLVVNAIKYSGPQRPQVHVSAKKEGMEWLFSVRDNGIGIEENHNDKIFKIFQRLHGRDEYEGTGIGLAIAKRIVERHGGTIWVESEPGKGSTFYFTIPQEVDYEF